MVSGRIGRKLAALGVFCILAIFLFPVPRGPYSVVHGPACALQAARAAARVRVGMVQAARKLQTSSPIIDFDADASGLTAIDYPSPSATAEPILRC